MRWLLPVVVALAGCDGVFGLTHLPEGASHDASGSGDGGGGGDAFVLGCAGRGPMLLCADFEDMVLHENGLPYPIPAATSADVTETLVADASNGHALQIDSTGGAYLVTSSNTQAMTSFGAKLAIRFDRTNLAYADTAILRLGATPSTGLSSCYVDLQLFSSPTDPHVELITASYCGAYTFSVDLVDPPSGVFIDVSLQLDYVAKLATTTVGVVMKQIPLSPTLTQASDPYVHLGIDHAASMVGPALTFDNVQVIAQ